MKLASFTKRLVSVFLVLSVLFFAGCGQKPDDEDGETRTIRGIECVLVKAGTFIMGDNSIGFTEHQVTLTRDFWIGKYEVTQAQYRAVIGNNPSEYSGDNNPVENVDWDEAVAFCNAVGGRLPTEAEWEFAARGGKNSKGYIYSGSNSLGEVGWSGGYTNGTQSVGTKVPNELGIYDMSGNVWEWCNDWYDDYPTSAVTNPTGPGSGSYHVFRGGGWGGYSGYCRVAARDNSPDLRNDYLGLRVVFDKN